jgi:hypothetical protein
MPISPDEKTTQEFKDEIEDQKRKMRTKTEDVGWNMKHEV